MAEAALKFYFKQKASAFAMNRKKGSLWMHSVSIHCDTGGISIRVKIEIERKLVELEHLNTLLYQQLYPKTNYYW